VVKIKCPACGLDENYQKKAPTEGKTQCTGCGAIFFNKEKI